MTERINTKTCTKCKQVFSLDSFCKDKNRKDGLNPWCRGCRKKHYADNRHRFLEYARKYRNSHPKKSGEYYKENREKIVENNRRRKYKLKLKAFNKVSSTIKCKLCSFEDDRALCVDHINNNGADDRRIGLSGEHIYRKIIEMTKEEVRQEYQLLCRNCNWIKLQEFRRGKQ